MEKSIVDWLRQRLDQERFLHSKGAGETAKELAVKFGANPEKAEMAGFLHDNAKFIQTNELLEIINENNLDVTETERKAEKTLHAIVGAFLAQKDLGINDKEILDAIRWHTLGKKEMSLIEKVVFLADKIEPYTRSKDLRDKILSEINETNNLDKGILVCYDLTIRSLLDRKLFIDPRTVEVWNCLISKLI